MSQRQQGGQCGWMEPSDEGGERQEMSSEGTDHVT